MPYLFSVFSALESEVHKDSFYVQPHSEREQLGVWKIYKELIFIKELIT